MVTDTYIYIIVANLTYITIIITELLREALYCYHQIQQATNFFLVKHLLENIRKSLCIITKNITDFVLYETHFQAYHLYENYNNKKARLK